MTAAGAGPAREIGIDSTRRPAGARELGTTAPSPERHLRPADDPCRVVAASEALSGSDPVAALMADALAWLMRFVPASIGLFYTVDRRLLKFRSGIVVVAERCHAATELSELLRRYRRGYHDLDPFAPRRLLAGRATVMDTAEISEPFERSVYALEFLAALGASGQTTLVLRAHGQIVAGVDLMRGHSDLPISHQQLAFLRGSQPFLEHAYLCALGLPAAPQSTAWGGPVPLTRRETEIVRQVADGATNAEIAAALTITEATVKTHLVHVFEKLGVRSRTQLAVAVNAASVDGSSASSVGLAADGPRGARWAT